MRPALAALALLASPSLAGERLRIEDREAAPALLAKLDRTRVTVDFKDTSLPDVAGFLTRTTGAGVIVSPLLGPRLEEIGPVTLSLKEHPARKVLNLVLEIKDLGAVVRHGVLMITTLQDARGKPVLRVHSIADLTARLVDFPGPELGLRPGRIEEPPVTEVEGGPIFSDEESLKELVQANCGAGTWEEPGVSISATRRFLVVRQFPEVQREIARLLDRLR